MITKNLGVTFISTRNIFCNEDGCLVRSGDSAKNIFQVDLTNFSAVGSSYLISHAADKIFDGISTFKTPQ